MMESTPGLTIVLLVFIFARVDPEVLRRSTHLETLQGLKQTRHKRNAVSGGTTSQPHITVHHYHYYYYCCPEMAAHVKADPRLAQAVHNASCGCDQSSVYCQVPFSQQQQQHTYQQQPHQQQQQKQHQQQSPHQQQHQNQHQQQHQHQQQQQHQQHSPDQQQQQQQQHQQQSPHHQQQQQEPNTQAKTQHAPKQPYRQDPFHINRMFDDPVGKDFFDFVTNNFIRRDSERELDECLMSSFDDPICKDFFNFFNQNFIRKPEKHAVPGNLSTHTPSYTTQQTNTHQPHKFRDLKDFHKVDSMFNELENNMKKAFSKTSDLGKMLGIKLDDFR